MRAHACAAGGWATIGMLVRSSAARPPAEPTDGQGEPPQGAQPASRGWLLSDLDPDLPTLLRLEVHGA